MLFATLIYLHLSLFRSFIAHNPLDRPSFTSFMISHRIHFSLRSLFFSLWSLFAHTSLVTVLRYAHYSLSVNTPLRSIPFGAPPCDPFYHSLTPRFGFLPSFVFLPLTLISNLALSSSMSFLLDFNPNPYFLYRECHLYSSTLRSSFPFQSY